MCITRLHTRPPIYVRFSFFSFQSSGSAFFFFSPRCLLISFEKREERREECFTLFTFPRRRLVGRVQVASKLIFFIRIPNASCFPLLFKGDPYFSNKSLYVKIAINEALNLCQVSSGFCSEFISCLWYVWYIDGIEIDQIDGFVIEIIYIPSI